MKIPYDAQKHAAAATHINLNSIDLQGLHSVQVKVMLQNPVQLDQLQMDVFYHTTIPFYRVLLAAGITTIIAMTRRYLCKFKKTARKDQQPPVIILEGNKNPEDVPATFSLNVLK